MGHREAQLRNDNSRLCAEVLRLGTQVADLKNEVAEGKEPLKLRVSQLEARAAKLAEMIEGVPKLIKALKLADALSFSVKKEFDFVRDKHPESKDGFSCPFFQAMEKARDAYEEARGKLDVGD